MCEVWDLGRKGWGHVDSMEEGEWEWRDALQVKYHGLILIP